MELHSYFPLKCFCENESVDFTTLRKDVQTLNIIARIVSDSGKSNHLAKPSQSESLNQEIEIGVQRHRRRQWHPTPVLLPGKSHGQRSLVGYSPWGREVLDTTEQLHFHFSRSCTGEGNGNPHQCSCQGWGSLVGCHLWGHTESDTTEATQQQHTKTHFS